jgi:predicted Zn-dependent peptidase
VSQKSGHVRLVGPHVCNIGGMGSLARTLLVGCLAFSLPVPSGLTQPLKLDLKRKVLDNGVTVVVWERPSAGRIGTRMFYRVDIAAERPGTAGLTHMLEHHLFKGSDIAGAFDWEKERDVAARIEVLSRQITDIDNRDRDCLRQREVFAEVEREADCRTPELTTLHTELESLVAQQNALSDPTWYDWLVQSAGGTNSTASTGRDWMKFDIDLPANKLELFMWTERSRIEHPVFRQFEAEREVVVDQIRRYDNRPDGKFDRALTSMTYDAHPYGWAHWFSDLTRATREDHWEIFHTYFIPQNTVIVVVGEVQAARVFEMAEAYWGDWQMGRPSPRLRTVEPPPVGEKRLQVTAPAGPVLAMHVRMPAIGHADAPVFEVLAELLGGRQGLATRVLVDDRNLATSVRASAWASKYPSHLSLRVDARANDDLPAVEAALDSVLASIAEREVGSADVRAAADRLVLRLARNLEDVGSSAVTIGSMEAIQQADHLNALPGLWQAVTPDDLARVVDTYFKRAMRVVGELHRGESSATTAALAGDAAAEPYVSADWAATPVAARPGEHGRDDTWTYGGAVDAWYTDATPAWARPPASAYRDRVAVADAGTRQATEAMHVDHPSVGPPLRSRGPLEERSLPSPSGQARTGGFVHAPASQPPATAVSGAPSTNGLIEPLAVAEQPWFGPPWMAERRPSRFATPAPVRRPEDLRFESRPFTPPDAGTAHVDVPDGPAVFVVEDTLLPMVQATVFVDAPSTADPRGKEGLAALTAALVEAGGTTHRSRDEVVATLDRLGASLTVTADRRGVQLHMLAPAAGGAEGLALLAEMVSAPRVDTAFEAERDRLATRASRAADAASEQMRALFDRTLYGPDHPLARRATPESVRAIALDDVTRFHRVHFAAARMAWAVSGAVTSGTVQQALASTAWPSAGSPADWMTPMVTPGQPLGPETRQVVTRAIDSRQGHVIMGHVGIEGEPADHAALELMHHVLAGGGFFSRMMRVLRTDTGITAALYGEVEPGRGSPNPYLWRFSGRPETLARGVRLALDEIEKMRDRGVTPAEFEAAQTAYLDGLIPASYETAHRTAERFAHRQVFGVYAYQSPQYLNYYAGAEAQAEALRRLTIEDVNRAARTYLHPDRLVIAVGGPLDEIQAGAAPDDRVLVGGVR